MVKMDSVLKSYQSGDDTLEVLRGISLECRSGESVAIVGTSGCGKSTLLNILGGLDKADQGRVEAYGYHVHNLSEKELTAYRSQKVGFIFQFHYLLKDFTARENVMLPALMAGRSRVEAGDTADRLLSEVHVEDRASHFPSQLSGGERQRVALARALVNDPDLILADEPTGNLDEGHKNLVADLLFDLTSTRNKTLVLVTHAADLASRADRTLSLVEGRLTN